MRGAMSSITAVVLAAFVGYGAAWYFGAVPKKIIRASSRAIAFGSWKVTITVIIWNLLQ